VLETRSPRARKPERITVSAALRGYVGEFIADLGVNDNRAPRGGGDVYQLVPNDVDLHGLRFYQSGDLLNVIGSGRAPGDKTQATDTQCRQRYDDRHSCPDHIIPLH